MGQHCVDCDGLIPEARLVAKPETTKCVQCQEGDERDGKFKRHRMDHKIRFKGDDIEMEPNIVRKEK